MATRFLAAWSGGVALVLLTGQHRALYRLADAVGVPALAVAVVTGATGLAWYEVAYAIGRTLRSFPAFALLPYLGAAAGLAAAAGLIGGRRWLLRGAAVQVACAVIFGGLAFAVILGRTLLGHPDPWRLAALSSFVLVHGAWGLQLVRAGRTVPHREAGGAPTRAAVDWDQVRVPGAMDIGTRHASDDGP